MLIKADIHEFFITINRDCTLDDFIRAAKVKYNSYAGEIVSRLYDVFVSSAMDVCEEYDVYYRNEYENFEKFLYWKYNLEGTVVDQLMDGMTAADTLRNGRITSGGDYPLSVFLDDGPLRNAMEQMLDDLRYRKNEN